MSCSGSCREDELEVEQIPMPQIPSTDADPNQEQPPGYTSRMSIKQVVAVIKDFSEYKRWLVTEIGFGGMLHPPMHQKLNLRLSAWLMSKVKVHRRAIHISDNKVLKFWAKDVGKLFGIPCGSRDVKGRDADINSESIDFIKRTLRMD